MNPVSLHQRRTLPQRRMTNALSNREPILNPTVIAGAREDPVVLSDAKKERVSSAPAG